MYRWGARPFLSSTVRNSSSSIHATTISSSSSSSPLDNTQNNYNNLSSTNSNDIKTMDVLSLDSIRSTLIRQEETIIFALIERAQFRRNDIVYQSGGFGDLGLPLGSSLNLNKQQGGISTSSYPQIPLSFLEYMLIGTEVLHCGVRRYTSPEEHAFFPHCLPSQGPLKALPQLDYPPLLSTIHNASSINFNNPILLHQYIHWIVPMITVSGDDEQHGSTVLADIAVLQALSRRVHYGKFVAESKYQSNPDKYIQLVQENNAQGVLELLTNQQVEEKVLKRAKLKAATYGREPIIAEEEETNKKNAIIHHPQSQLHSTNNNMNPNHSMGSTPSSGTMNHNISRGEEGKVDPFVIERIYRDFIIPLTKDIEVAYLFRRCGKIPPQQYSPHRDLE